MTESKICEKCNKLYDWGYHKCNCPHCGYSHGEIEEEDEKVTQSHDSFQKSRGYRRAYSKWQRQQLNK